MNVISTVTVASMFRMELQITYLNFNSRTCNNCTIKTIKFWFSKILINKIHSSNFVIPFRTFLIKNRNVY